MRICIIAEGSYPYILGGVSSWINGIINSFRQHEFVIYAISSNKSVKGKYKYNVPSNVVEIIDVFLDDINVETYKSGKKYKLSAKEKDDFKSLLCNKCANWDDIFSFFQKSKIKNISEFFLSIDFYQIVSDVYKTYYEFTPFTEYLWAIRSMYLILFYLLSSKIPEADIYHSVCTGYAGVIGAYGKFLYDKPFILSEHGIYTREREEEIIKSDWIKDYHKDMWKNFFLSLSSCAYNYSDVVTTLFEDNKKFQIDLGCNKDKIIIIPNGIDVSLYSDKNISLKKQDEYINIGAIVRVVPIKDIKTMILSFRLVKDSIKNARFYIMGPTDEDEEYYRECCDLVEELDLEDVIFTGTIKVSEYIGKMDIMVLTSISEGQPLALMEAMAAGKPNVCTSVGNCRGLLFGEGDKYSQAGFINFVTDFEGISENIIKLCKDEKLRYQMGQNGHDRIMNIYTKKKMIESYRKIYSKAKGE